MRQRMMSRPIAMTLRRAIPAAAAVAVILSACGDSADSVDDDATAATTEPVASATVTQETGTGDTGTREEARVAQVGDTVAVHYTGTLDDGSEFDSSREREPLTFTLGAGQVIPGFDSAVVGMSVGDEKEVRLEPDEAYGERTDERVIEVPKEQAPDGIEVGQQVLLGQAPATVVAVTDEAVTVDANHPLAGQALTFKIELVGVE